MASILKIHNSQYVLKLKSCKFQERRDRINSQKAMIKLFAYDFVVRGRPLAGCFIKVFFNAVGKSLGMILNLPFFDKITWIKTTVHTGRTFEPFCH
jgi:hypothetical protein